MGGARGHFRRAPWSAYFLGQSCITRPSWRATRGVRRNSMIAKKKSHDAPMGLNLYILKGFDQHVKSYQWLKNRVTKNKVEIISAWLECENRYVCRFYLFPLFQIVGLCRHEKSISEKVDVSEAQESRAFLFLPWNFGVFTRPASEKGCANGELRNWFISFCHLTFC